MVELKNIISNIKPSKGSKDRAAISEEHKEAEKAMHRLHRRFKSSIHIPSGLVHGDSSIKSDNQSLRQDSFEPERLVPAAKPKKAKKPAKDYTAQHAIWQAHSAVKQNVQARPSQDARAQSLSKISSLANAVVEAASPSNTLAVVYPPAADDKDAAASENQEVAARHGLEVLPKTLGQSLARRAMMKHSRKKSAAQGAVSPYEEAVVAGRSWETIPSPLEKIQEAAKAFEGQSVAESSRMSQAKGKSRVPAISDIDWSYIGDEEAHAVFKAYDDPIAPLDDVGSSSPTDSAVVLEDEDSSSDGEKEFRKIQAQYAVVLQKREKRRRRQEALDRQEAELLARKLREEQEEEDRIRAVEVEEQLRRKEEEEERLATERARLRDCAVCGDSKKTLEFPAKTPSPDCEHPASTCTECLQAWMASEFETKGCDGIKCPECPSTLQYMEVMEAASAETFEAYDKMATRNALGGMDSFAWCLGLGCNSGQLNEMGNGDDQYMDCANCGYKQCLTHKVPWHTGETCTQYDYRTSGQKARDEEKKTEAMLDSISKLCPNRSCGWRIQKIDGCEHMTCRRCKFEFCWLCLASHKEIKRIGNTAHAKTCKFHSENLEVTWPFNMH